MKTRHTMRHWLMATALTLGLVPLRADADWNTATSSGGVVTLRELAMTLKVPKGGFWDVTEDHEGQPLLDQIEWTADGRQLEVVLMANALPCSRYYRNFSSDVVGHEVASPPYLSKLWAPVVIDGPGGTVACADVASPRPGYASLVAFYHVTEALGPRTTNPAALPVLADLLAQAASQVRATPEEGRADASP